MNKKIPSSIFPFIESKYVMNCDAIHTGTEIKKVFISKRIILIFSLIKREVKSDVKNATGRKYIVVMSVPKIKKWIIEFPIEEVKPQKGPSIILTSSVPMISK